MSGRLGPHTKHGPRNPCPICGSKKRWCLTFTDDNTTWCMRRESARPVGDGWFHGGTAPRDNWQDRIARPQPPARKALDPATLDAVLRERAALSGLTLAHRQNLLTRGFTDEDTAANGYASFVDRTQQRLVAAHLLDRFGAEIMEQVPGFYWRTERNGQRYPAFAGGPGILVPVRDERDLWRGFQIRLDEATSDGNRYIWSSSLDKPGGTGSGAPLHIARPRREAPADIGILTEGPLKGDITAAALDLPAIALPGVSTQRGLAGIVKALGLRQVGIAFDADAQTNDLVLRKRDEAARTLAAIGCSVELITWPAPISPDGKPTPKGIDDAIRAGVPLDSTPYPFPSTEASQRSGRIEEIPSEVVPVIRPRPVRTIDEIRAAHHDTISDLLEQHRSGVRVITSATGSGKTHAVISAITKLRLRGKWPRVRHRTRERPARCLYLAQTKEQVQAFAAASGGLAHVVEGRNPDPSHAWGCHRPLFVNLAGEGRHNPARDVCKSCREEYESANGRGWLCHYLQSKAASESAWFVAATYNSFLNASEEIADFDIVICDEALSPSLLEAVTINHARLNEWSRRMDELANDPQADAPHGIDGPFRRLIALLKLALAQCDPDAKEWTPATPALCTHDDRFPALVDELLAILPSKKAKRYDFEKPRFIHGAPDAPLRAARDLIEVLAAELDRPDSADTRIWLTPSGIRLYVPRQHLIDILRQKTTINLDATPSPELRLLFPDLEEISLDIAAPLHVTQVRDSLATRNQLTGEANTLRERIDAALEAITTGAAAPVIFTHKGLNPDVEGDGHRLLRVSNPAARYGHFDRETRALNHFADTDLLVIVGRYSAPINELRARVQALRWSATPPIPHNSDVQLLPYVYHAPDGTGLARWTPSDPDPDVNTLVRWSESSTILQAIGRGRATLRAADAPLRVVIFSNLPVAGLTIDRMATLEELGAPALRRGSNAAFQEAQTRCQERNDEARSATARDVAKAIATLLTAGRPVTFSAVAKLSGIRRQTLYETPALRALIEQPPEPVRRITSVVPPGSTNRYIRSDPGGTVNVIRARAMDLTPRSRPLPPYRPAFTVAGD